MLDEEFVGFGKLSQCDGREDDMLPATSRCLPLTHFPLLAAAVSFPHKAFPRQDQPALMARLTTKGRVLARLDPMFPALPTSEARSRLSHISPPYLHISSCYCRYP